MAALGPGVQRPARPPDRQPTLLHRDQAAPDRLPSRRALRHLGRLRWQLHPTDTPACRDARVLLVERLLAAAMERGAEFAEVYVERNENTAVTLDEHKVKSAQSGLSQGVGVRVIEALEREYELPPEVEVIDPTTPEGLIKYDDLTRQMITKAEEDAELAESVYEHRHSLASAAKKVFEASVDELRKMIRDRREGRTKKPEPSLFHPKHKAKPDASEIGSEDLNADGFVDFTDAICPGTTCPLVIGHVVVHRAGDHLTATYAATLGDRVIAEVNRVLDRES